MTHTTDNLRLPGTAAEAEVAALDRALALAEAAGESARVATLRALWFDLERRRLANARTAAPGHRERRHQPPPHLVIDDELADAWLRGRPLPPR
jgi:hypothetical protein